MKKNQLKRSDCPINYSLETFGDMWSLLIVRDIVYFGKKTYGEFLDSEEAIATNILASRLADLEQKGILAKRPHATDKRKELYLLTEKGLDLIPVLLELENWGALHNPQAGAMSPWIEMVKADKGRVTALVCQTVRNGGSIFTGPGSVISQLMVADKTN